MPVRRRPPGTKRPTALKKKDINPRVKGLTVPGHPMPKSIGDMNSKYGAIFVGLDPSLNGFGMCCVCECGAILDYPTLKEGSKKNGPRGMRRVEYLMREIEERFLMIKHCTPGMYAKIFAVREDYALSNNDQADTPLKELGGVLEWELHKMGIPLFKINITVVKKFAAGTGHADKKQMADGVYKRLGYQGDEDQVDAFAVAVTGMALANAHHIKGMDPKMVETISTQKEHDLTNLR